MTNTVEAFRARNLSVLAYANGFTMWHYVGGLGITPAAEGWWDDAKDMLRAGDQIVVNYRSETGGCPRSETFFVTESASAKSKLMVKLTREVVSDVE